MSPIIHRIASITDLEVNWPREQTAWLSTFEQEQLQWCRHLQRQREWLAGRWLCKQLIHDETTIQTLTEIDIQSRDVRSRAARPRVLIAGRMQAMDVSITHSQDWIAVAISTSPRCRVGIDLVPRTAAAPRTLAFWLTEQEQQWLHDSRDDTLLPIIWSIKESVYKATNRGETFRPQQLEVRRSETGDYECHGAGLSILTDCKIVVDTHQDHILTVTTHQTPSLAEAS